jgi:hypothetical protein
MNRKKPATQNPPRAVQSDQDSIGFLAALGALISPQAIQSLAGCRRSPRGRKARVPLTQLLPALIFHCRSGAGTLAEHLFQWYQAPLADSSWSDRRARLPWPGFTQLMQWALRPLVQRRRQQRIESENRREEERRRLEEQRRHDEQRREEQRRRDEENIGNAPVSYLIAWASALHWF